MGTEADKSEEEIRYLNAFFEISEINDHGPIEKLNPPVTPDLKCVVSGRKRYFEMSRMCSQDLTKHVKLENTNAIWLDDQVERLLNKKLSCEYQVSEPIDLVFYDVGWIALPPDVVVAKLNHAMKDHDEHPYATIWYLAEGAVAKIKNER